MAGGANKVFSRDPVTYIRTHQLMINPQPIGAMVLPAGAANIDLVSIDPQNPQFVRLENYDRRQHGRGATPLRAFFLPAVYNDTSVLAIDGTRDFVFTADLSGCLFAAYGANATDITVEHVNVRDAGARVPIQARAAAIINAGYAFYKILAPSPVPNANAAHVKVYAGNSSVVGVRSQAGWTFHYKPQMDLVAPL